jgi:hypothetical protein
MSLAIPFHQSIRRRPKPHRPYEASMVYTQYIRIEPDQLRALEINLGDPFEFAGTILGRIVRVQGVCASRQPHTAIPQAGHWQNDLLANLDASAKAMTQLQLDEQRWSWEWVGAEYVVMDLAILPIEDVSPMPAIEPANPRPVNRQRR